MKTGFLGGKKDNESCFPSLTFRQRMYGFLGCIIAGLVIDFISFGALFGLFTGHPAKFAITYSLGNLIALMGTSFLIGPTRQLRNMKDPTRLITSIVFVLALIGTLLTAIFLKQPFVTLIFIIIQFCALIWYCLSYIPFARALAKRIFKKAASSGDEEA